MLNFIYARLLLVLNTLGVLRKADESAHAMESKSLARIEESLARIEALLTKVADILIPEPVTELRFSAGPIEEQPTTDNSGE